MENLYDYKKFAILYVDDEEKSLKYFTRAFEDEFRIFTASSAHAGRKLLEEHKDEIGLLMTETRWNCADCGACCACRQGARSTS